MCVCVCVCGLIGKQTYDTQRCRCKTDLGYRLATSTGVPNLEPPMTAAAGIAACLQVIDGLTPANNGDFLGPDGGQMPF